MLIKPKKCRSRELRAGVMYTNCGCWKRNGLQDQCPRSLCQGRPACMCVPIPNCCPSTFPLKYAYMTMGTNQKIMRCKDAKACNPPNAAAKPTGCPPNTEPVAKSPVKC